MTTGKNNNSKQTKHAAHRFIAFGMSWILLPVLLTVAGLLYGIINYPGASFYSLNYYHPRSEGIMEYIPLENHGVLSFSFVSQMDNLGTVAVRFKLPKEDVEGNITFRLIDLNTGDVVFTGNYDMRVLYGDRFYPLGFPTIRYSKNTRYRVVLASEYSKGEKIAIHFDDAAFLTKYHVDRINPINETERFTDYFKQKLNNLAIDREFYSYILLYLLPMILYFIWEIMNNKYVTVALMVLIAYRIYNSVYIPLQQIGYDAELYFKLATLFFVIVKFNIGGKAYFILATGMFLLSTLYIVLQKEIIAQEYAIWTYYFIALGLCAFIWEYYGATFSRVIGKIYHPIKNVVKTILFIH